MGTPMPGSSNVNPIAAPSAQQREQISVVLEKHRSTVIASLSNKQVKNVQLTVPGMGTIVVSKELAADILGYKLNKDKQVKEKEVIKK